MAKPIVEVKNLTKDFNGFLAVDNISFEIEKGEIVGLLGPNGAGKTTTIFMLLGVTKPTSGEIEIFSLDLERHREEILNQINFSSAYTSLMHRLTVFENLFVFSSLYGIKDPRPKINELLKEFELIDLKDELTRDLSSGELTRLNICKALLNDPKLLFLDEPASSLDLEIAKKVHEFLLKIRRERNISMLYTSHNMEEITKMCDRVIFLNRGRIVASDSPLNLTKIIEDSFLTLTFDALSTEVKKFSEKRRFNFQIIQPNILKIITKEEKIGEILTDLARNGVNITDIIIEKPSLEDVFLKLSHKK